MGLMYDIVLLTVKVLVLAVHLLVLAVHHPGVVPLALQLTEVLHREVDYVRGPLDQVVDREVEERLLELRGDAVVAAGHFLLSVVGVTFLTPTTSGEHEKGNLINLDLPCC